MAYAGPERRKKREIAQNVEPVFLEKKYAEVINDIELKGYKVGQRICLSRHEARMLIQEGWARPVPPEQRRNIADVSC